MKKILILLFIATVAYSQNLDSLFQEVVKLRNPNQTNTSLTIEETEAGKCGFGLVASVKNNYDKFSYDQQLTLSKILSRPSLEKSIVSPSGFFRIHYNETGTSIPNYGLNSIDKNVLEVAIAFDSAYNYEINILGYPEPPTDGSNGGDEKYDVYITNIGDYGYTESETTIDNTIGTSTSFIVIDNDYGSGFATNGIDGARVTAAHEFHHAIQLGNYGLHEDDDIYYYEITSTAFEEFVYDEINDYYYYMKPYFNNPARRFTRYSGGLDGYDLAVWNIFLKEKFGSETPNMGDEIIKRSWELIGEKNYRAITAISTALIEYNYSFLELFKDFGVWLYFTNERTNESEYFEEAENYPLANETSETTLTSSSMTMMLSTEPTSTNYLVFYDQNNGLTDTLTAILSNSDIEGTFTSSSLTNIDYTISKENFSGANSISDIYFSAIEGTNSGYVSDGYIINGVLASNFSEREEVDFAYPQPFNYEVNTYLFLPTEGDDSGESELYIYSSNMNLIYSGVQSITSSGKIVARWNGLDNNKEKLASGVYFYVTKANGKIKKGKFVVVN